VAFVSTQVALNTSTPTALWTAFAVGNAGSAGDPIPVVIICSAATYIGGSAVSSSNGFALPANTPFSTTVFGTSEVLYAVSASAAPSMDVLMGRQ